MQMVKKPTGMAEVKVRMTKDLHRKIERDADKHGQTINAEILRRLEGSFQSDRMFEGILAPHNAKLVRMVGQAAMMAGDWRNDKTRFDALEEATIWILYAVGLELIKKEREEFDKAKPTRAQLLARDDEMGSAIAQIVIPNEMPDRSVREVMHEHVLEHVRVRERSDIRWGRKKKPAEKLSVPGVDPNDPDVVYARDVAADKLVPVFKRITNKLDAPSDTG